MVNWIYWRQIHSFHFPLSVGDISDTMFADKQTFQSSKVRFNPIYKLVKLDNKQGKNIKSGIAIEISEIIHGLMWTWQ